MPRDWIKWIGACRGDVLIVSLATHFSAMLLGICASVTLQGEAWPAAAQVLANPSIVFALPQGLVSNLSAIPGDSVQLVQAGPEPCGLNRSALKLLSVEPVILLSRTMASDAFDDVRSVTRAAAGQGAFGILASNSVRRCREPAGADVVIERVEEIH
jgi:hypothetical protein